MIKMIIKQSRKTGLSLCNNFTFRIHCNERVSMFMHAIQKPTTEKILMKGLQISEHMLLYMHDVINTIHVTQAVGHIPMVRLTLYLKYYSWEVVKVFAVYI